MPSSDEQMSLRLERYNSRNSTVSSASLPTCDLSSEGALDQEMSSAPAAVPRLLKRGSLTDSDHGSTDTAHDPLEHGAQGSQIKRARIHHGSSGAGSVASLPSLPQRGLVLEKRQKEAYETVHDALIDADRNKTAGDCKGTGDGSSAMSTSEDVTVYLFCYEHMDDGLASAAASSEDGDVDMDDAIIKHWWQQQMLALMPPEARTLSLPEPPPFVPHSLIQSGAFELPVPAMLSSTEGVPITRSPLLARKAPLPTPIPTIPFMKASARAQCSALAHNQKHSDVAKMMETVKPASSIKPLPIPLVFNLTPACVMQQRAEEHWQQQHEAVLAYWAAREQVNDEDEDVDSDASSEDE